MKIHYHLPISLALVLTFGTSFLSAQSLLDNPNDALPFTPQLSVEATTWQFSYGYFGRSLIPFCDSIFVIEDRYPVWLPLLPVVFFDHPGNATIPARYQLFSSSKKSKNFVDTSQVVGYGSKPYKYLQLLNIVGYRMSRFDTAQLTLLAGYSTDPAESQEVGFDRANAVKEYLTTVWNVSPERIRIPTPHLLTDSLDTELEREEERRVVLAPNDWRIIAPVEYQEVTRAFDGLNLQIIIDPNVFHPEDITSLTLSVWFDDNLLTTSEIPPHPDSTLYRTQGLWEIPDMAWKWDVIPNLLKVQVTVGVRTTELRSSNIVSIPVKAQKTQYSSGSGAHRFFALPFFGYRETELNGLQAMMLQHFLLPLSQEIKEEKTDQTILSFNLYSHPEKTEQFELIPSRLETELDFFEGKKAQKTVVNFGNRIESSIHIRERTPAHPISLNTYKNVQAARYKSVIEYLQTTDIIDSISAKPVESFYYPYDGWSKNAFSLFPEGRFYKRFVILSESSE